MDQNLDLISRIKQGENLEEEMIRLNTGLVLSVAKRFLYSGVEFEDLVQIGTIGLLKAVRNFDLDRGVMFSTYAVPVIAGEIKKYLRDNGSIKISRTLREQYMKLQKAREILIAENQREPTLSELAKKTGISPEEIPEALEAGRNQLSLDAPASADSSLTLSETVSTTDEKQMDRLALKDGISALLPEEKKLISLRYFLCKTQQQTADLLGMTQVQVSRKEKKIIEKMKEKMIC